MPELRLLLYMGIRHKEQIEGMQKESIRESGIRIVAADREGGSPFDMVESIRFLKSGGLVSMTGDMLWKEDQRAISVRRSSSG